jgi:enoyl-CoA hydratase/carnithine racemase
MQLDAVCLDVARDGGRLTHAGVDRLHRALDRPGRLVLVQGVPGLFCQGLDLRTLSAAADTTTGFAPFSKLLARLEREARPVVALVDGPALGGGCALAAVADLVLATPAATFGLPEALWGLSPAIAFPVVTQRVTVARARLLALGMPAIDAAEAHRWGLVDEVVDDLQRSAARYGRRLGRAASPAVAEIKDMAARLGAPPALVDHARDRFDVLARSESARRRLATVGGDELPWVVDP